MCLMAHRNSGKNARLTKSRSLRPKCNVSDDPRFSGLMMWPRKVRKMFSRIDAGKS